MRTLYQLAVSFCVLTVIIGITFQVCAVELRDDPIAFATVVESRQLWVGGGGVLVIIAVALILTNIKVSITAQLELIMAKIEKVQYLLGYIADLNDGAANSYKQLTGRK